MRYLAVPIIWIAVWVYSFSISKSNDIVKDWLDEQFK